MTKTRKVLRTLVVLGLLGGLAAVGAFSAFSSQTNNPNNSISSGTVQLSDNDAGSSLYQITNAKPNNPDASCIRVLYTGSLPADVRMWGSTTAGALNPYVNVKVESGTQASPSFDDCTGFNAQQTLYNGDLSGLANDWNSGYADNPGDGSWDNGDARVYRVTVSLDDTDAAQGLSSGDQTFTWEARNQ